MNELSRLDALRQLQALEVEDGYARVLVWRWKQADRSKLTIREAWRQRIGRAS